MQVAAYQAICSPSPCRMSHGQHTPASSLLVISSHELCGPAWRWLQQGLARCTRRTPQRPPQLGGRRTNVTAGFHFPASRLPPSSLVLPVRLWLLRGAFGGYRAVRTGNMLQRHRTSTDRQVCNGVGRTHVWGTCVSCFHAPLLCPACAVCVFLSVPCSVRRPFFRSAAAAVARNQTTQQRKGGYRRQQYASIARVVCRPESRFCHCPAIPRQRLRCCRAVALRVRFGPP
jgi:hypothetical protein